MKNHTRVAFSLLLVVCMLISGTPIATPAVAVGTDNHASEAVTETLPIENNGLTFSLSKVVISPTVTALMNTLEI